jgi:hypothetical protein
LNEYIQEEENSMKTITKENKVIIEFDIGEYNKDLVDLLTMIEIANKSKATEEEITKLANEIKSNWWKNNKKRFSIENNS